LVLAILKSLASPDVFRPETAPRGKEQMRHLYNFGSPHYAALNDGAKLRTLISDLNRVVRIFNFDIAMEEERAGVFDPFKAAYPILARTLTARRDNLKETITALEQRAFSEPVVTD
jgi:hypothetical protein